MSSTLDGLETIAKFIDYTKICSIVSSKYFPNTLIATVGLGTIYSWIKSNRDTNNTIEAIEKEAYLEKKNKKSKEKDNNDNWINQNVFNVSFQSEEDDNIVSDEISETKSERPICKKYTKSAYETTVSSQTNNTPKPKKAIKEKKPLNIKKSNLTIKERRFEEEVDDLYFLIVNNVNPIKQQK